MSDETPKPTIYLACRTYGPNNDNMRHAVLALTWHLANTLLDKLALAARLDALENFYRIFYYFDVLDYYGDIGEFIPSDADVDCGMWVRIPVAVPDKLEATRSDCAMLGVRKDSVIFTAYEKHGSDEIETPELLLTELQDCWKDLTRMKVPENPAEETTHTRLIQLERNRGT